jgi:hypothetical protein
MGRQEGNMAYGDFNVSVGETVGVVRRNRTYGGFISAAYGTVSKINGHGHIFVQLGNTEHRFTRRGDAYKDNYGPHLCHADQLRREQAQDDVRKERARLAREMEQALKEGWSYSGTFHTSEERIAQLKNILEKMEKLVDH